ncbi:hypothetical protein BZG36_03457, partial [Bifiguratus adelaidae]
MLNSTVCKVPIPVSCVGFTPNNKLVLAGGGGAGRSGVKNKLFVYDVQDGASPLSLVLEHEFSRDEDAPMSLDVHPKDDVVVLGINGTEEQIKAGQDKACRVYKIDENSLALLESFPSVLSKESFYYQKVARFSPSGDYLLTGSTDGSFTSVKYPSFQPIIPCKSITKDEVFDVDVDPDGTRAAVLTPKAIQLLNLEAGKFEQTVDQPTQNRTIKCEFRACRFGKGVTTGNLFTIVNSSTQTRGFLVKWNANTLTKLRTEIVSKKRITAFAISPNGQLLASADNEYTIRITDAVTLRRIWEQRNAHGFAITALAFSRDGRLLVSGSADNTCRIIRLPQDLKAASETPDVVWAILVSLMILLMAYFDGMSTMTETAVVLPNNVLRKDIQDGSDRATPTHSTHKREISVPKTQNGRQDLLALKQQLVEALGDSGPQYWDALREFVTGRLNRQEFDFYANLYLSRENAPLHNAFILATIHNAQRDVPPPQHQRSIGWGKKRRGLRDVDGLDGLDMGRHGPNRKRLKKEVMSLPKADRDRIKSVSKTAREASETARYLKQDLMPHSLSRTPDIPIPAEQRPTNFNADFSRGLFAPLCADSKKLPNPTALRDRMTTIALEHGLLEGVTQECVDFMLYALESHMRTILSNALQKIRSKTPLNTHHVRRHSAIDSTVTSLNGDDSLDGRDYRQRNGKANAISAILAHKPDLLPPGDLNGRRQTDKTSIAARDLAFSFELNPAILVENPASTERLTALMEYTDDEEEDEESEEGSDDESFTSGWVMNRFLTTSNGNAPIQKTLDEMPPAMKLVAESLYPLLRSSRLAICSTRGGVAPLYKARNPSFRTVLKKQSSGPLNNPSALPDVCMRTLMVSIMDDLSAVFPTRSKGVVEQLTERVSDDEFGDSARCSSQESSESILERCILITGGGTGLGKEVARQLAREGMHIGVNYSRSAQEAQETVQELETEFHVKALAIQADVSVVEEIERMVDETVKHFGRIDLLINNAGVTTFCEWSNLEGLNEEDWDKMLKVNTKAPFFAARAAARYMKKNPEGVAGSSLSGSSVAYATSKAGMNHVTRCLAKALAPEIRVNAVAPGLLVTRWGAKFGDAGIKAAVERSALKMPTSIQECAAAYVFLAKNGSTTGEIITTRHRKAEDTISPSILMKNVSSSPSLPTPKSSPSSPTLLALPITNGLQPNSDRSSQPENKQTNMPNSLSTLAGTEISALAAGDDVSYKRELINQKVRAENRERKKRWREQNEEK